MTRGEVKEYLSQLKDLDREIKDLLEEQEKLFSLATKSTANIKPVNVQGGQSMTIEDLMNKRIACEKQVNGMIGELSYLKLKIPYQINEIDTLLNRQVLRRLYVKGYTIKATARDLGVSERQVADLHNEALDEFAKNHIA